MSITNHKIWPELLPFVRIEKYGREGSGSKPRIRIEFKPMPPKLRARARLIKMPCVRCKRSIYPVRARAAKSERGNPGHIYYAPTCQLKDNVGCSRSAAARDEYTHIQETVG